MAFVLVRLVSILALHELCLMLSQFFDKGIVTRIYSHLCFFLDTSLFILSKFKVYDPSQFLCIVGGRGQVNVLFTHIDNSSSTIHFKDDAILEVGKKELFFFSVDLFYSTT